MRNDISDKIDKPLVESQDITKLKNINSFQKSDIIKKRVDILYSEISNRYKIDEREIYNALYLKVRKMFLEEDR